MSSLVYSKLENSPQEARCISEGNYSHHKFSFVGNTNANLFFCMCIFWFTKLRVVFNLQANSVNHLSPKEWRKVYLYITSYYKIHLVSPPLKKLRFCCAFLEVHSFLKPTIKLSSHLIKNVSLILELCSLRLFIN